MKYEMFTLFSLTILISCHIPSNGYAEQPSKEFVNSIGMEFVLIPNGTFMMGAGKKKHNVVINSSFYMGKYEVTQNQWNTVMGKTPFEKELKDMWIKQHPHDKYQQNIEYHGLALDELPNPEKPVYFVTWNDAQAFVSALNKKEGKKYQLPSEAEWEYAARAGTTTRFFFGNDPKNIGQYAWYAKNSDKQTHPVGQLKPNPWGLYDIYGNVAEWCRDKPAKRAYDKGDPCAQETLGRAVFLLVMFVLRKVRGGIWWIGFLRLRITMHLATQIQPQGFV